jgi:serine/alanine adding enzyme
MVSVSEYTADFQSRWSDYVVRSPHATIAHQIGWRDVIWRGLGHVPKYFIAQENGKLTGVLPLFLITTWWRSKYLISLPWIDYGGILADDLPAEQSLLDAARNLALREGAQFLEFRSIWEQDLGLSVRLDKLTFHLPLESNSATLWDGFNAKLRNQIRKSQKSGLTTEFGGLEVLDDFYRVFAHNMRDLGTPVWGKGFFASILSEFRETARLIIVRKEGAVTAAGLVLAFKDSLYVPSASAYRRMLEFCPNHALYWAVIEDGFATGFKYLDFGRSSIESGTYNFKKQWGALPQQLHWQYSLLKTKELPTLNPADSNYQLLIKIWQKLPLSVANVLGPLVIRNFP